MAKMETLDWRAFMAGEIKAKAECINRRPRLTKVPRHTTVIQALKVGTIAPLIVLPTRSKVEASAVVAAMAQASGGAGWDGAYAKALFIADWLAVGVFFFAGAVWTFGNRTKGIELLISGATGYLVMRHAVDLRDWLKTI